MGLRHATLRRDFRIRLYGGENTAKQWDGVDPSFPPRHSTLITVDFRRHSWLSVARTRVPRHLFPSWKIIYGENWPILVTYSLAYSWKLWGLLSDGCSDTLFRLSNSAYWIWIFTVVVMCAVMYVCSVLVTSATAWPRL